MAEKLKKELDLPGVFSIAAGAMISSGLFVLPAMAFAHEVEQVTARELAGATLEAELREILVERDNIVEDRFDRLIKDCEILDIDHSTSVP